MGTKVFVNSIFLSIFYSALMRIYNLSLVLVRHLRHTVYIGIQVYRYIPTHQRLGCLGILVWLGLWKGGGVSMCLVGQVGARCHERMGRGDGRVIGYSTHRIH